VVPLATAVDSDADGVTDAEALGVADADGSADAVAEAEPVVDGVADPDDRLADPVGARVAVGRGFVGAVVGFGLDDGDDGCAAEGGVAGAVPGGSAVPPFCQENATVAPAGTDSEPAARLEYFQPEVPSDQYRPQ
jgi:hypothetical protein